MTLFLRQTLSQLITIAARLRRWVWQQRGIATIVLGAIALVSVLVVPARATVVQVSPLTPQLGDTISVVIHADAATTDTPAVTFGSVTYPAFPIGTNRYRALVPTTPLDQPGRKELRVIGMGAPQTTTLTLRDRSFSTQRITVRGGGSGASENELAQVNQFKQLITPQKYWNGPFARPATGGVTTTFGVRRYYNGVFATDYYHKGVDYGGGTGAPVTAPAAGRVVLVGREADGFVIHGNTIGVDHGQGVSSIFIHLSRIDVQEGDFVQAGQRIGAIGATGSATGPNLHWGLYVSGQSVDPVPWREQGFE